MVRTIVSIRIAGFEDSVVFSNLVLHQVINDHHTFDFIWNVGSFQTNPRFQLDLVQKYLGEEIVIELDPNNIFSGIITEISIEENSNSSHCFRVSGKSASILIDDGAKSTSYFETDLATVVKKSLEGIQGNLLKASIDPSTKDPIDYLVQYNESDFQFLRRIAIRFGEWLYFDGTNFVFGAPVDSKVTLKSGVDLDRLVTQAKVQPTKFYYNGYDPKKAEKLSEALGKVAPLKNSFAAAALDKSDKMFGRQDGRGIHATNVSKKSELQNVMDNEMKGIATLVITVEGDSSNSGLKAGCLFKVENQGGILEYVATSVSHYCNLVGHYENRFEAVPASAGVPPYTNPHIIQSCGMQSAFVKENHDPDGINRIRVQFHWQKPNDLSPWIRMCTPHAGGGKGFSVAPEIGEEVTVDFEGSDVDKPIAVASMYNGKAKSGGGDAGNNIKGFSTRSGCKVSLDDQKGSVTINDAKGNTLAIDGEGNITITSSASIAFTSGGSSITLKSDGTISLSGKDISIDGSASTVLVSGGAAFSTAAGGSEVLMKGLKATVEGTTEVSVTGAKATFNGDATNDLSSMGMTSISGAIVKLN